MVDSQSLRLSQAIATYQAEQITWLIDQLSQRGFSGLTPTHINFLSVMDCDDNFASELARRLNLSRQAVHKTVAELTSFGLIETAKNEVRRNSKVIQITAQGEELIAAARQLYSELDQDLAARFSTQDIEQLIDLLKTQFSS